jgi:ATP-dependent DNA helicase RecG
MSPKELLESLNELDEQTRIEAKQASDVGKSLLETVCAFANEPGMGGGWLLLGVKRDENALFPAFTALGIRDPDKLKNDLVTQCREVFNRPVHIEFDDELVNGAHLVSAFVAEAEPADKPVFFKKSGLPGGAFRRVGASGVRCTEDDLFALYQERGVESFDESILKNSGVEDFDSEAIEDYRTEIRKTNPSSEILDWPNEELLQALNCLKIDAAGKRRPTLAGILLFGSQKAIRRLFPLFRVDYIRVPGTQWMDEGEEPFASIDMRDSVMRLIRRSVAAVMDDLPTSLSLPAGAIQRESVATVPLRVVREAVVNALMHRSYRKQGPIQIIRYANRLEIRNPGYSLKPDDNLGESGSVHRNPILAAVLHETRFAETKGAGIRVIRRLMDEAGLVPPIFESDRDADLFTVTFFFHHFLEESDWTWLGGFKDFHLDTEEARALVFVRDNGKISNAAYRDLNKVDTLPASLHLRRLKGLGLLEQMGKKGPGTFYVGSSAFNKTLGQESTTQTQDSAAKAPESPPLRQESPPLRQESQRLSGPDLPLDLRERIKNLGERGMPSEIRAIVVELCTLGPLSSEELARTLHRDATTLVRKHLKPLVENGRLRFLYPDKPNRPDQKYLAIIPEKD